MAASGDDEKRLLAEAAKMPMEDRVAHTSWKVRVAAYTDIQEACKSVYEESDPCLAQYGEGLVAAGGTWWVVQHARVPPGLPGSCSHRRTRRFRRAQTYLVRRCRAFCLCVLFYAAPLFAKAVADGNANGMDKALEALLEFLRKAPEQLASRCGWAGLLPTP